MSIQSVSEYTTWLNCVELASNLAHDALEQLGVAQQHEAGCHKTEKGQARLALATLEDALKHLNRALQQPTLPI